MLYGSGVLVDEFPLRTCRALLDRQLRDLGELHPLALGHLRDVLPTAETVGDNDFVEPCATAGSRACCGGNIRIE
jgi:hypothetical protein